MVIWVIRSFLYSSSVYSCHFLISSASVRSIPFLSFIVPIFAWKFPFCISNFVKAISSLSHSIVFLYVFALITGKAFLSLLAILRHSVFKWVYLSFSPLPLASLLFSAICKPFSDNRFAFLFLCNQRWRSSKQLAKTRPEADYGSVHCQIQTWRKWGKTTRPFRYDLNQIPYDYTVEVRNRFKGLDLIDRVHDELWTEVRDIVQEAGIKTIPKKKKCKKANWLSEEALQIAVKRREVKSKGEKEII